MKQYPTQFVESNAILAAQEQDEEAVREILVDLNLHELRQLQKAADYLSDLCDEEMGRR